MSIPSIILKIYLGIGAIAPLAMTFLGDDWTSIFIAIFFGIFSSVWMTAIPSTIVEISELELLTSGLSVVMNI